MQSFLIKYLKTKLQNWKNKYLHYQTALQSNNASSKEDKSSMPIWEKQQQQLKTQQYHSASSSVC